MKRYYFVIISQWRDSQDKWYYYGRKTYQGCRINDLDKEKYIDMVTFKSLARCEKRAKQIVEENNNGYPWLKFSYEIKEYEND